MSRVVVDSNVLGRATDEGKSPDTRQSWDLLQCIQQAGHRMVACRELFLEYQNIPQTLHGAKWFWQNAPQLLEMHNDPPNGAARQAVAALGVDAKDAGFILLAAEAQAPFTTWEKFTGGQRANQKRDHRHREVCAAVKEQYHVEIWNPPHAWRRMGCHREE